MGGSAEVGQSELGIGSLLIDPEAERNLPSVPGVTPRQEDDFYARAGAEHRLEHNRQNLGVLGKFFGSNSSAPTNIAGFVVLVVLLIFLASFFLPIAPDMPDLRKLLLGVVGSALGFIFGAASKK